MGRNLTVDRVAALVRARYGTHAVLEIKRNGSMVIARARQGDLVYCAALGTSASEACARLLERMGAIPPEKEEWEACES